MQLPKNYEPSLYESDIYDLWEKSEAFKPRGDGKPYSIALPPPNANGNLHLGHALVFALEDIAVRYHRLKGDRAVFLPGADHAGFETQVVYERQLAKEGKSRFDFTREELYAQIYDFVAQNRDNYTSQFRKLGGGVDWSRFTFTLDQKVVSQVYKTFKQMWDDNLIYRGERLVNYCTFHGTAFADIEVEHKEEKGGLWYISYPLTDGSGSVTVATTRPETMFGDTAVAVHPNDKRYGKYIGKTVKLPLTNREIPIIGDDFVDVEFGTGAVKITPAHDPNDFEAGKRHDLPMPSVITFEGTMAADVPEAFRGLPVLEARTEVAKALKEAGVLEKEEEYTHKVGHCYKCGTTIQPLLKDQWFVDVTPLKKTAIEALDDNKIVFHPEAKGAQLRTYLSNLRDWNISRQIAWGIPIPAFQNIDDPDDWVYDERVAEEIIEVDGKTYRRDPDVFDTWFSSGSWPYTTTNLGDDTSDDFSQFYPLSLMETGSDILYMWVGRMLMLGLYVTGEIPFREVYLHGLILDEHGQKMSKSKGNVINPLDVVETYGADAVRMGVIAGTSAGNNQPFVESKVVGARNFCNKLWNIARFIEGKTENAKLTGTIELQSDADHWIMGQLNKASEDIARALEQYRFAEAYETLYHFVWDDFADWYIEASKATQNDELLHHCLESILQMAHPFAPFMTETIWQALKKDGILAMSSWPTALDYKKESAVAFEAVKELIGEVRAIAKNIGITNITLQYSNAFAISENAEIIQRMARIQTLEEVGDMGKGLKLTQSNFDAWVDIDLETAASHRQKLDDQLREEKQAIDRLEARLANSSYVANAPATVIAQTRQQLTDAQKRLAEVEQERKQFDL